MNTPCTHKSDCLPCDPVLDTQEPPDEPTFLGLVRTPATPRLGEPFSAQGCVGWCFSPISQAEADLCAIQQAALCVHPQDNFFSAPQSCTDSCGGSPITTTVEAGTVISGISQADADARAASICADRLVLLCGGNAPCSTKTHGFARPYVDPAIFIPGLVACCGGNDCRHPSPPWDGYLRTIYEQEFTGLCGYQTDRIYAVSPGDDNDNGYIIVAALALDVPSNRWNLHVFRGYFTDFPTAAFFTLWRGFRPAGANEEGTYTRTASCSVWGARPDTIDVTFSEPP